MKPRLSRNQIAGKRRAYRQLWRVVDGAVFDALYTHQDYLTEKGKRSARESIVKRVTGAVLGFAEEARGPSSARLAADRVAGVNQRPARGKSAVSKWRAIGLAVARVFGART